MENYYYFNDQHFSLDQTTPQTHTLGDFTHSGSNVSSSLLLLLSVVVVLLQLLLLPFWLRRFGIVI